MSFTEREQKVIKREMSKLKSQISLRVFTDYKSEEDGTKNRSCMSCNTMINLLNSLKDASEGKLIIEERSTIEDMEQAEKFEIKRIPTILFLENNNKELIRYTATPNGNQLVPFIKTLQYYSGVSPFYKDQIKTNLKNISKSDIRMFVTHTCNYCPQVIPVANLFAIVSDGKINVEIIDINANQDVAQKYNISGVPYTLINEKEHLNGMFTPQDLLDKLTKGKRDFGGMYA
jgi:alkyl hydroperoxide reductase subunit AhpF